VTKFVDEQDIHRKIVSNIREKKMAQDLHLTGWVRIVPSKVRGKRMTSAEVSRVVSRQRKTSKIEAARKIASLVEEYMAARKLSERQKNIRISHFTERLDDAIERYAKR
jgi:hypothetical protein